MIIASGSMSRIIGAVLAVGLVASGAFAAGIHVNTDYYAVPGWWTTVTVEIDSLYTIRLEMLDGGDRFPRD